MKLIEPKRNIQSAAEKRTPQQGGLTHETLTPSTSLTSLEGPVEHVDLRTIAEETAATFRQNRTGARPAISLNLPSMVATIPWPDRMLGRLVREFFYETLLTNDSDAGVAVSLHRQSECRDLSDFVGIKPAYWTDLRISGRGVNLREHRIEILFSHLGYLCAEWVGSADSQNRLGIFASAQQSGVKFVLCLDTAGSRRRFDLLLPVHEPVALPAWNPGSGSKRLTQTL